MSAKHAGSAITGAAVLFVLLRLLAVSHYDWHTAFALLHTLELDDAPGLFLGTFMADNRISTALLMIVTPATFFFYLRTDIYVLVSTVLGCVDLHGAALQVVRNRFRRLLGKPETDESALHPVDRKAARWYSWLVVVGYTLSLTTFALAGAPVLYRFVTGVVGRLTGDGVPTAQLLDSIVFTAVAIAQCAVLGWLMVRERVQARRDRRLQHVIH